MKKNDLFCYIIPLYQAFIYLDKNGNILKFKSFILKSITF
jgi:hypothetical protein